MEKPPLLVTFPGKLGDLLWAMATVKTLAARYEVTLLVSKYCEPLVPLLKLQPYLKDVIVDAGWEIQFTAPVSPSSPPEYSTELVQRVGVGARVLHLGLEGWPSPTLVEAFGKIARVEPSRPPWIFSASVPRASLPVTFTDEWAELKAGLLGALFYAELPVDLITPTLSRMALEFGFCSWDAGFVTIAQYIRGAQALITDKSVMRVLAYALGVPTIVVEPSPPRHQAVFDPPKVGWPQDAVLINGFDAREVVGAVRNFLEAQG